ncbi:MAG: uncharacterized protein A8A55_1290 [Amphiamblys sp. WSBS2006]|nr:MAG: uncharacterized protein A8A55_1290 [Amphiamblys sp. WSBS2006]
MLFHVLSQLLFAVCAQISDVDKIVNGNIRCGFRPFAGLYEPCPGVCVHTETEKVFSTATVLDVYGVYQTVQERYTEEVLLVSNTTTTTTIIGTVIEAFVETIQENKTMYYDKQGFSYCEKYIVFCKTETFYVQDQIVPSVLSVFTETIRPTTRYTVTETLEFHSYTYTTTQTLTITASAI